MGDKQSNVDRRKTGCVFKNSNAWENMVSFLNIAWEATKKFVFTVRTGARGRDENLNNYKNNS